MYLPKQAPSNLDSNQRIAWEEMRNLLSDLPLADRQYNAINESSNGTIISTDVARYLDSRYADPPDGMHRDLAPGWDLAWRYAQNRLFRDLSRGGKQGKRSRSKMIRFMAGGWAAGKTHALRNSSDRPDLVWDGTLGDIQFAVDAIDHALHQSWWVEIAYIYRNLELAMYGAVERANIEGRNVPLEQLPKSHRESQQTVIKLLTLYAGKPGISFLLLHNLGRASVLSEPVLIPRNELETNGALHHLERHEHYYATASKYIASSGDKARD